MNRQKISLLNSVVMRLKSCHDDLLEVGKSEFIDINSMANTLSFLCDKIDDLIYKNQSKEEI
jgi:hypothetical protein